MPGTAPADPRQVAEVVDLMRASRSILFITGAGLSADSGLPTYRGIGGLYTHRDTDDDLPIEAVLSGDCLAARPELTWKYLLEIERACRGAGPNRGHEVIAEAERRFDRVWVLTQNVDGFHRRAGSRNVIEMHGNFEHIRCTRCRFRRESAGAQVDALPPRCPDCRAPLRPEVVLFGERLPERELAVYQAETRRGFDLVFSIGTTSVFPYISGPVLDAHHLRKPSVEINPGATEVSDFVTVKLASRAAPALEAIWSAYNK